ncbi:hypothetical protein [Paraburkholderia haematera]|uniref:Uncharacterized protein n=1 Tax=Paraburkholderia haematera TaxID=2793077 RepID=A0ABM8QBM6_9BURK|nr:hypothetical protein [Paraburkholderia haematera]CAE6687912.1 hypothetical protein R69888_00074 [Paraburkholderia haematera]
MYELPDRMRQRLAETVISPSSALGLNPGADEQKAIRMQLREISLKELTRFTNDPDEFGLWLDEQTARVRKAFFHRNKFIVDATNSETGHYGWGYARKFVNLFLADAARNRALIDAYKLDQMEHLFEVPLDQHVTDCLKAAAKCGCVQPVELPKWERIYKLRPEDSAEFQRFALKLSEGIDWRRHNLDLIFWRREKAQRKICAFCRPSI